MGRPVYDELTSLALSQTDAAHVRPAGQFFAETGGYRCFWASTLTLILSGAHVGQSDCVVFFFFGNGLL